jgi:ABC-2 type transport system ATP-binding protein
MIDVAHLTKRYGRTLALDHVTFSIQPGEVVGLLGPNGAGKTTMLKVLTGYLPPSEGGARVGGLDVQEHALEVRRRIGYLPEANPLYDELAVYESLVWTARLRGMPEASAPGAIRQVIESCGLVGVVAKDVAHLSKGYRQRLGLAQAILHDPDILILDEPTSGLDPNQQSEVRQLIQLLRQRKTVLLSTHILSEAQSVCDRVLIIHQGRIVADGSPEMLGQRMARGQRLQVELKAPGAAARERLAQIPGVSRVVLQRDAGGSASLSVESEEADVREALFHAAVEQGWPILQLTPERLSLEDVFRQLTTADASPAPASATAAPAAGGAA